MLNKTLFAILFLVSHLVFARFGSFAYDVEKDSILLTENIELYADSLLEGVYITDNTIEQKTFNPKFRNKYKGDEFDYTKIKPKESLWDKISRRLSKLLENIFGYSAPKNAENIAVIILRILSIVVVVFLIYLLISVILKKEGNFFFSKKNKKNQITDADLTEDINEINFSKAISNFELLKNYRFAIRYHYLQVLKKLSDKREIEWNPEKTNRDYVNEFKNPSLKNQFQELSYIFDNVWYGEFKIDENHYLIYKDKFNNFI